MSGAENGKELKRIVTMNIDKLFFTSDLHFGHGNIIGFCDRPFSNVEEMDRTIVNRWNNSVPEDGEVYLLGDVSFHKGGIIDKYLWQLNGTLHLLLGNHDKSLLRRPATKARFASVQEYLELTVLDNPRQKIVLCHFPFRSWNKMHYGTWNLHGHSHGTLNPQGLQLDVGVDTHNFAPYSYNQIKEIMSRRKIELVDYHGRSDNE